MKHLFIVETAQVIQNIKHIQNILNFREHSKIMDNTGIQNT